MAQDRLFRCWCPDDGDEQDGLDVEACAPHKAAEVYAARTHAAHEYPEAIDVMVRDAQHCTLWTVEAERLITFSASGGKVTP